MNEILSCCLGGDFNLNGNVVGWFFVVLDM